MFYYVLLSSIIFYYVLLCSIMFYYVLLCSIMFYYVLLCYIMLYYVILCSIMFYYVLLCSIMLYYVLLCSIMFYYVLLCSIMFYSNNSLDRSKQAICQQQLYFGMTRIKHQFRHKNGYRSKRRQVGSATNKTATRRNGNNLNGDNYGHIGDRQSKWRNLIAETLTPLVRSATTLVRP